jgi:hypothetical protein
MNNVFHQTINELVRKNEALAIKLELAYAEISRLKMEVMELEKEKFDTNILSLEAVSS